MERYGIDEVAQWYFEVWNEPNIDFWAGEPKQATYFELYDHTRARSSGESAAARRRAGHRAGRLGGRFIRHCATQNRVPVDFVSTPRLRATTRPRTSSARTKTIPRDEMVCRAVKKVHDQIKALGACRSCRLIWTRVQRQLLRTSRRSPTRSSWAPWLADTIRQCDGLADMMSYWTFDDVFEENGVVSEPLYGGFGTIASGGIKKPSYYAYALLHQLGETRLAIRRRTCW